MISSQGGYDIIVTMDDDKQYKAQVRGTDAVSDLAVLKIDATGLTAVALGDSDLLQLGEQVVAIGNSLGLGAGTVTSGIVSGLNRVVRANGFSQEYIQTDAAINPGNSGGPLINLQGQVIGINTLKSTIAEYDQYGQAVNAEGIGFAIPISDALPIIQQLLDTGKVESPGIGISCIDSANMDYPGEVPEGVAVISVVTNGPAARSGIEPDDIILSLDGSAVKTVGELTDIIQAHNVGDKLDITFWRNGQEQSAKITIGDLNDMG